MTSQRVRNEQALERLVEERTQELESLLRITRVVSSTLELDALVRLVLLELREVVEYSAASLILIEGSDLVVHDVVFDGAAPEEDVSPVRVRIPLAGPAHLTGDQHPAILDYPCVQVAQSAVFWDDVLVGRPVVIGDVLNNPGQIASDYRAAVGSLISSPELSYMRCWAAIPLQTNGRTLGYFGVASSTPDFLTDKHIKVASAFADHVALAIDNARLYEQAGERTREIERRRAVAEGLRELIGVVNSGRSAEEILDAIVGQARRLLESDASQVFVPPAGSQGVLAASASSGIDGSHVPPQLSINSSAVGLAFRLGRAVAVDDVEAAYRFVPPDGWNAAAPLVEDTSTYVKVRYLPTPELQETADQTRGFGEQYHGFLAVPLISATETYGVLTLSYREARQFTSEEVALAMAFADQATLGVENARVTDQSLRLAAAEERQRLAHDLHDSVAQVLYGIALGAGTAKRHLASNPATVAEPIDYISSLAAAGLAEMRALIFDLQPDSLAKDGLLKAVERQVEALEARHGLTVVNRIVQEPDIPVETKEAVYLVIREAVHNVVKHAQATQVVIELSETESSVVFRVSDDGAGFDSSASYPGHLGLHSMRGRVQQLGGHLSLQSAPGQGTTVEGRIPAGGAHVGPVKD